MVNATTTYTIGAPTTTICSNTGALLLAETLATTGLAASIDHAFADLEINYITHSTGHTLTSMALALALGGDDVSDIALLDELAAAGLIPPAPNHATIHRRHRHIANLGHTARHALYTGIRTARAHTWSLTPRNPAACATTTDPLTIDIDATEIIAHSNKDHAQPTWKKHFGFHPLCAMVDHGTGATGEPLAIRLRPGNAAACNTNDHRELLAEALTALPDPVDGKDWGRRLLIRCDAGGRGKDFINDIDHQGFAYSIGIATSHSFGVIASELPADRRHGIVTTDGEVVPGDQGFVADITDYLRLWRDRNLPTGFDLSGYPDDARVIIRAEYPAAGAQLATTDVDGRRVRAFVTNQAGSPSRLDRRHSLRGRCELRVRDIKDMGLGKLPHTGFEMNQAWVFAVMMAQCVLVWAQMLGRGDGDRVRWWVWEPKTVRVRLLSVAGSVACHARGRVVRFAAHARFRGLLEKVLARIRSLRG